MRIVRASDTRETTTPNASMRTLASPELAGTGLSMWRYTMLPGQCAPLHVFDVEQIWTVVEGHMQATGEDVSEQLAAGDTIVFAPGELRRIACLGEARFEAMVICVAGARASTPEDGDRGTPPWIV
jgi:quercetin dioxygenase-like cupin family protein